VLEMSAGGLGLPYTMQRVLHGCLAHGEGAGPFGWRKPSSFVTRPRPPPRSSHAARRTRRTPGTYNDLTIFTMRR